MTVLGSARLALRSMTTNLLRATDGRDVLMNSPDGWAVTEPWLYWLGPGNDTSGPFGHPIPGANAAGGFASIPGVARASSLIVDTIAVLPWHLYRGETEKVTPTPDWIADPQALRLDGRVVDTASMSETRLSAVDFWGQWILSALWFGDGFAYVPTRDEQGAPKPPLWLLNPDDVELRDGGYWVADERLDPGTIIHLRGQLPIIAGRGSGVLARFAADLGITTSLRSYMAGAFTAGVPAGYLKALTPNLSQDQADALKSRWMSQHGGRRSIAVLNATTEFHPLTWSPVELAAADFARITLGQIALMFGLPAYMLGAPVDSSTYANVESRNIEFHQFTLLPWIGRIEEVLSAQVPRGTKVRVSIDGLLRADTKTRYEAYAIALDKGFLTVDEVRAFERRPPLEATL